MWTVRAAVEKVVAAMTPVVIPNRVRARSDLEWSGAQTAGTKQRSSVGASDQVPTLGSDLPSGPWLLTSWWHMEVENLIFEDDAGGYFEKGRAVDLPPLD